MQEILMAMSLPGVTLNGLGSLSLISRSRRSIVGGIAMRGGRAMRVGRKNVISAPQHRKPWAPAAVRADGNPKNDPEWLDDTSQKASEFMKEKGSEIGHVSAQKGEEAKDRMDRARNHFAEIAGEALDTLAENAKSGSEFVTEKAKVAKDEIASMTEKAKDFFTEKVAEFIDCVTDMSKKTTEYIGDKAKEAKEAILPPKD